MNRELPTENCERSLRRSELPENPFELAAGWYMEAMHGDFSEPGAMMLATSTSDGHPSSRMVLLKEVGDDGLVFFTNYNSRKGEELEKNPHAAALIWWDTVQRQIRVEGVVTKIPAEESDDYFAIRPRGSQIGAWASEQSREISDRAELDAKVADFDSQYEGGDVPRPPYWGGYRLQADRIEFWQGRNSRLHDRFVYERTDDGWEIKRLAP